MTSYNENRDVGVAGELFVAHFLMLRGFSVFKELSDTSKVDLIVLHQNIVTRIQVKTGKTKDGSICIPNMKYGRLRDKIVYSSDEVDVIAMYVRDVNRVGFLSTKEFETIEQSSITFRVIPTKNNQKKKIRVFEEIENFERLIVNSGAVV